MEIDSVIPALKTAAESVSQKSIRDPYGLSLLVRKAENGPKKAEPEIKQLLRELRQIECLQIFENTMQVMGHSATKFDITNLATGLLRRSLEGGRADGAVADLKRYLDSKEISVQQFVALTGLTVDQKRDLGNGIFLIPWNQLPHEYLRDEIYKRFFDIPFKLPSSAIYKEITITQIQVPSEKLEGKMNRFDDLELRDALFCACLVGPLAPEILVSGYLPQLGRQYPPQVWFILFLKVFPSMEYGLVNIPRMQNSWLRNFNCQRKKTFFAWRCNALTWLCVGFPL